MAQLVAHLNREALGVAGEPAWVTEFRRQAWDLYTTMDLPARTDEAWRRTDLAGLDLGALTPDLPAGHENAVPAALAGMIGDGHTLVLRNGQVVHRPAGLPAGVIATDMETAVREYETLVREHFMTSAVTPDTNIFTALHAALFRGGAFVYLPPDAALEQPIQIVHWLDGQGAGAFGHTLIVADRNAAGHVVEYLASPDFDDPVVHVGAVEIFTKPGANLKYHALQNFGEGVWTFTTRRAMVGRDSKVHWLAGDFGGELVRSEQYTVLHEDGGEGLLKIAFFGTGRQHIDVTAHDIHVAGAHHTVGDIAGRGVLDDKARGVFRGLGRIQRNARGCECFLKQNTLMLSRTARADSIPALLIDDDDVARGGHAATTGKVNEDELFYLQCRGLSKAQATKLIVDGFFRPLLQAVELPTLQQTLQNLIDRKLKV